MVDLQPISLHSDNNNCSYTCEQSSPSSSSPTSHLPSNVPILLPHHLIYQLPPSSTLSPPFYFQENMFPPFYPPQFYYYYFPLFNQPPSFYFYPSPTTIYAPPPIPPPSYGGFQLISMDGSAVDNTQNDGVLLQPPSSFQRKRMTRGNGNRGERRIKEEWKLRQKEKARKSEHASGSHTSSPPPAPRLPLPPPPSSGHLANCTTVIVKNIPNSLSRAELIYKLDLHCRQQNHKAAYDFLYLPFDFNYEQNLGYAFVNFISVEGASTLALSWNGKGWSGSGKIRRITRAKLQGIEMCKRHFEASYFHCFSEKFLPVEFSQARDGFNGDACKMTIIGRCLKQKSRLE